MIELKEGFMTIKELAEWSGRSEKYLSDSKKKWCQTILSNYADYELVRGGVNIKCIFNPIFQGSGFKEVQTKYLDYWGNENIKADTNTNCWQKMKDDMKNKITNSTGSKYVGQCRREDFGIAFKNRRREGKRGNCHYVYCKSINGQAVPFNDEELQIKKKLSEIYLCRNKEEDLIEMQALFRDYKNGDISEKVYLECIEAITVDNRDWNEFRYEFEKAIGCDTDFFIEIVEDGIKIQEGKFEW